MPSCVQRGSPMQTTGLGREVHRLAPRQALHAVPALPLGRACLEPTRAGGAVEVLATAGQAGLLGHVAHVEPVADLGEDPPPHKAPPLRPPARLDAFDTAAGVDTPRRAQAMNAASSMSIRRPTISIHSPALP